MQLEKGNIIFHNWIVKDIIGAGNFGTVYEIEREEFGRIYRAAAKVIVITKESVEETIKECDLMEQMKGDSHIVSYEDHYVEQSADGKEWIIYIRMELLKPLLKFIAEQGGILEEREVVRLGMDICQGLETCQKFHVLHKDIKLENIFVSDTGHYKLGDFGISKVMKQSKLNQYLEGTRLYMAPEALQGKKYDVRADVYSLGLVLYRLLNHNRAPFMPSYPQEVSKQDKESALKKRLEGAEIPLPCNAGEDLGNIIKKACNYNPDKRFQVPQEMYEALETILDKKTGKVYFERKDSEELSETICIQDGSKKKLIYKQYQKKRRSYFIAVLLVCIVFVVAMANGTERHFKSFRGYSVLCATNMGENIFEFGIQQAESGAKEAAERYEEIWMQMPKVLGLQEMDAVEELILAGCKKENIIINYEYNRFVVRGFVLNQSILEGSMIKRNSVITINVSLGEKPKKKDDVIWKPID